DKEAAADRRPRVALDARQEARELRDGAAEEVAAPAPEAIRDAVPPNRVHTRVQPEDLAVAAGGGVAQAGGREVLADAGEDAHAAVLASDVPPLAQIWGLSQAGRPELGSSPMRCPNEGTSRGKGLLSCRQAATAA